MVDELRAFAPSIAIAVAAFLGVALLIAAARTLRSALAWIGVGVGAALGGSPRAAMICAALVVTAVVVPAPFDYVAGFVLRLVRFLAVDAPLVVFRLAQDISASCAGAAGAGNCVEAVAKTLPSLWRGAVGPLLDELKLPPLAFMALLVFAFSFAAMWVAHRQFQLRGGEAAQQSGDATAYKAAAIGLSLAGALYLSITAIIAIPVFSDRLGNLDDAKRILDERMPLARAERDKQVKAMRESGSGESMPRMDLVQQQAQGLWAQQPGGAPGERRQAGPRPAIDTSAGPSGGGSGGQAQGASGGWQAQQYRAMFLQILDGESTRISALQRARSDFIRTLDGFDAQADGAARSISAFFETQNTGRVGAAHTMQHAAVLASSFDLWLSEYVRRLDACRSALRDVEEDVRARHVGLAAQITSASQINAAEHGPDRVFGAFKADPYPAYGHSAFRGYPETCNLSAPNPANFQPRRRGPAEALSIFGYAAGWLLSTESAELALVVGLLGFGFFGAISTSFIREFSSTSGNALPPSGWIIPALVRGIAAAMLVFLVVVGGIAVFTQSSPRPNAYAVFLACFIAAVFSEDVWEWARRRQREHFRPPGGQAQPGSASPVPAAAPEAASAMPRA